MEWGTKPDVRPPRARPRALCVVSDRQPHSREAESLGGPTGPPLPVSCPPLGNPSCLQSASSVTATLSAAGLGDWCLSSAGSLGCSCGAPMCVALAWWHRLLRFSVLGPVPLSQFLTHPKDACGRLCVLQLCESLRGPREHVFLATSVGVGAMLPVPLPHAGVYSPLRPSRCPAVCPGPCAELQACLGEPAASRPALQWPARPGDFCSPVELTSVHTPARRPCRLCWALHQHGCTH